MAEGEWHPFRGPADWFLPDDPEEAIFSVGASAAGGVGTYVAHRIRLAQEVTRMAAHHQVGSRAVQQAIARRQLGRMTVSRGLGIALGAVPIVGWTLLALSIAYSLPPSGRQMTLDWWHAGSALWEIPIQDRYSGLHRTSAGHYHVDYSFNPHNI